MCDLHVKSVEKIKNILRNVIVNPELLRGKNNNGYDLSSFKLISDELNKRKIDFKIDSLSCYFIFSNIKERLEEQFLLGDELVNSIVEDTLNFYKKTPLEYQFSFHVKQLRISVNKVTHPIVNISNGEIKSFLSMGDDNSDKYTILKIIHNGYFSGTYPSTFLKEAIQKLKVFIFILKSEGAITIENNMLRTLKPISLFSLNDGIFADFENIEYPFNKGAVKISQSFEQYLKKISANIQTNDRDMELKVSEALKITNLLLSDNSKEALRIKSAISWLIQSAITDDETMSFIQLCMGLESIFGDNDYEGGLTTILSDRCAYLIGKNIKSRNSIKDMFRKIYQLRSKIIHGVRSHLSESEEYMRYIAESYLERSILKEIENLELLK